MSHVLILFQTIVAYGAYYYYTNLKLITFSLENVSGFHTSFACGIHDIKVTLDHFLKSHIKKFPRNLN